MLRFQNPSMLLLLSGVGCRTHVTSETSKNNTVPTIEILSPSDGDEYIEKFCKFLSIFIYF